MTFCSYSFLCVYIQIGHVTKSGDIAGPRVLEHIVDVVLYMEVGTFLHCFYWFVGSLEGAYYGPLPIF